MNKATNISNDLEKDVSKKSIPQSDSLEHVPGGEPNEPKTKNTKNKTEGQSRKSACDDSKECLDTTSFMLDISDFTLGMAPKGGTTEKSVNTFLGTIIQKLMMALGVLSVLIMTIGGGYMILYHGKDELLSKGKSIFMSGVYALVVALSSYYLVSLVRFILYKE
ncbi:MAG: hypothetical protein GY828_04080 [Candidatus Gracilibacteria bacterium]|nr:hypothetical protein [Candidatus Gracilibacteria bacterium]